MEVLTDVIWGACAPHFAYFAFGMLWILSLRAARSFSILLKTSWNWGLLFCMRLLDAMAMLIASLSIASSAEVNMVFDPCGFVVLSDHSLMLCDGVYSVKPERQNMLRHIPVSPARLDQPRFHYPRNIGRRPMGGL